MRNGRIASLAAAGAGRAGKRLAAPAAARAIAADVRSLRLTWSTGSRVRRFAAAVAGVSVGAVIGHSPSNRRDVGAMPGAGPQWAANRLPPVPLPPAGSSTLRTRVLVADSTSANWLPCIGPLLKSQWPAQNPNLHRSEIRLDDVWIWHNPTADRGTSNVVSKLQTRPIGGARSRLPKRGATRPS